MCCLMNLFFCVFGGILGSSIAMRWLGRKPVMYVSNQDDAWLDPNVDKIHEDVAMFIASDGNNVRLMYGVKYSKSGKPLYSIFPGERKPIPIKYWMPVPKLPN